MSKFNPKDYANLNTTTPEQLTLTIIHIDDITKSRVAKLEDWKSFKDPNEASVDRVSKKIITEIPDDQPESNPFHLAIYKLTLKDDFDHFCFAYEFNDKLPFLRTTGNVRLPIPIRLGGKIIIKKGTTINNGVLLINRQQCSYLGIDEDLELVKALNSNLVDKSITILQNGL